MTSLRKIVQLLVAGVLVGAVLVGTSEASTISIVPGAQTIAPAGTATVDIVLSGLTASETVGGFSLLLSFNNTIIGAPDNFTNDPGGVMGAGALDLSFGFLGGGVLDLFYLADLALTQPALKAAEGTGFVLASVSFTGLAEGLSPLTLSVSPTTGVFLSNFDGTAAVAATAVNGSVCVDNPNTPGNPCSTAPVPEPATISLLGAGLAAFVARRRRQAQSKI